MKFIAFFLFFLPISLFAQNTISLKTAMDSTRKSNLYIQAYRKNIDRDKSDIITAGLRPNPVFNQQYLQLWDQKHIDDQALNQQVIGSSFSRQTWFQFTKIFQLGGQRNAKIELATKKVDQAVYDVAEYEKNIVFQAGQRWLDVWFAKVNFDILVLAKKNADTLMKINAFRLEKEVITQTEYRRNQILVAQYNTMIKSAQQSLSSELRKLQFLMNTTDSIQIDMSDNFFYIDLTKDLDSLENFALKNRADILTDQAYVETTKANINLQKRLAFPTPEMGFVINPQNTQRYMGWYVQMPLPFFSRNQGEIQKSKILYDQAQQQVEATKSLIENEITYVLQEYKTNTENVERYKTIVADAESVLNTVNYAYLRGGTTIVDYLLAQSTWYETQKSYYETIFMQRKSYLQLLYVSGLINN